jgi:hypothetical protein
MEDSLDWRGHSILQLDFFPSGFLGIYPRRMPVDFADP